MLPFDADVSRQTSQPFRRESATHHEPHQRRDHTDDHDKFAQLAHHSKSCANRAEAEGAAVSSPPFRFASQLRESSGSTSLRANARTVWRLLRDTWCIQ